jgi:hypothetical protein
MKLQILFGKKKKQTYKPDSVFAETNPYHLSGPTITRWFKLPTLRQRTSNP